LQAILENELSNSFFNKSVQKELEAWPIGINASFVQITEQIVISWPNLGLPYTRPFGDGLFIKELKLARKRLKEITQ